MFFFSLKLKYNLETLKEVESGNTCLSDMVAFVPNAENLRFVCDQMAKYEEVLKTSMIIRYFLACLKSYYEPPIQNKNYRFDLHDLLLVKNVDLVLDEMERCVNRVFKPDDDEHDLNYLNQQNLKDLTSLTENSNFIHRPALDSDLIPIMPHWNLPVLDSIDILVGVTSHESFYFLYHDYNINEILLHTFIYSSLINKTDNLLIKLSEIHQNRQLGNCLKQKLFGYYGIEMSEEQLDRNSLKNNSKSLEFISDFDFVLPLATQLEFSLEHARSTGDRKTNLFVYEYGHATSINYLVEHMLQNGMDYAPHAKAYDNKVSPHFSELDFMFGLPVLSKAGLVKAKNNVTGYKYDYSDEEDELSQRMIAYWSSFAKYGYTFFFQIITRAFYFRL